MVVILLMTEDLVLIMAQVAVVIGEVVIVEITLEQFNVQL